LAKASSHQLTAIATQTPYNEICIKCAYIQGLAF
jgi:hypothetical protein